MNLSEHAEAISSAIRAAYDAGFELDNGEGEPIREMDLNTVTNGRLGDWTPIELPEATYDH
ncbi:hypothetical protein ACIQUL_36355 [Streptomyces sp. NPDC090303]|uniref:hypothetical protein n=1 Tax=Streptomyces sp. NPDC090303 TaxID=3365960 RepID=UPI00382F3F66